ncbi:MAG: SGNH/GDSL hydrolase family protein [Rhizobiales bacterium]|nr:SGNH/GDSL hydrolase family protein [Hyphomicrobiales bacterium]MBN9008709.1 SGNH/GDSL hydrolase family protein [Hyphomicrobiales bacterium]
MTRTVLCYGDSNTFGHATVPRPDGRYGPEERWPGVLRAALGAGWYVIEEGLGGRTTVSDDPVEGAERNGRTYLYPCLMSHKPLDMVIIMLGTNDLKHRFGKSAWDIAEGMAALATITRSAAAGRNGGAPEVILVSPPPILRKLPGFEDLFEGAYAKSQDMAKRYQAVADRLGIRFFDAGKVAKSGKADGFHLDPEAHAALGRALALELNRLKLPG